MNKNILISIAIVAIILFIFCGNGIFSANSFWDPSPTLTPEQRKKLLPTSGYELPYAPMKWNIPPIAYSHNCYDYAFNNTTPIKMEPPSYGIESNGDSVYMAPLLFLEKSIGGIVEFQEQDNILQRKD